MSYHIIRYYHTVVSYTHHHVLHMVCISSTAHQPHPVTVSQFGSMRCSSYLTTHLSSSEVPGLLSLGIIGRQYNRLDALV